MKKMTQAEAVVQTLERLGGIATLGQLNQEVFCIEDCEWKTKTPFASIRRIVQTDNRIYKIKPGLWALKTYRKQLEQRGIITENELNQNSTEVQEFNHSYYQGLLLSIGNIKGLETYAPNQDKNKSFANGKIDDLRSIQSIPAFSYEQLVKRSSTIDVIWFNERTMPDSFFEVEHSTDITNSLQKYNDLQDFHTKMYIVADRRREEEFWNKFAYASFEKLKSENRVKFLSYGELDDQYQQAVKLQSINTVIL